MFTAAAVRPAYDDFVDLASGSHSDVNSRVIRGAIGVVAGRSAMQQTVTDVDFQIGSLGEDPVDIDQRQCH